MPRLYFSLVLFDIDGTLLSCGPQVQPWFAAALSEVYGVPGELDGYDFAGKTDPRITHDLLRAAGLPRQRIEAGLDRMRSAYLDRLEAGLERRRMRLLPAVRERVEELAERPGVTLGLLTGNWERGARAKLGRFDLNRFFPFGAFGDDAEDRNDLVPVALERARRAVGRTFEPSETLIVGDSLYDVECARAHGVKALAVATGTTAAEALAAAGADWVVPDLAAPSPLSPQES